MRYQNPFSNELALLHRYLHDDVDEQVKELHRNNIDQITIRRVRALLHEKIVTDKYSCVAAQAAFNQGSYQIGIYPRIADENCTHGLAYDLYSFVTDTSQDDSDFSTFIAVFLDPLDTTETEFENLLWEQLQELHNLDRQHHQWSPDCSSVTQDPEFGFSFARIGFFIVGMHAQSSRLARQFPYPTLVFNQHRQFERLKEEKHFNSMKETIRKRELELQGTINPMLSDFGDHSEARQYSGRAVDDHWSCPFHASHGKED